MFSQSSLHFIIDFLFFTSCEDRNFRLSSSHVLELFSYKFSRTKWNNAEEFTRTCDYVFSGLQICVFSFSWFARWRNWFIDARLRSIRPNNTHVEAVSQLHFQLGLSMFIGSVRRWYRRRRWRRWWIVIPIAISLANGRSVLFTLPRMMMIVMSGVSVDRQSGIRGLATICLMPGGQRRRRRRRLMATTNRDSVLKSGLQSPHPVVRFSGRELRLWMRRSTQGVTGVMGSRRAGRDSVDRRGVQRRRAIIHDAPTASRSATSSFSSSSSSAVTGSIVRDGQRSRAAHLARRLAVDVGEALGEGGAAMRQEPDPAGPGARRPKF